MSQSPIASQIQASIPNTIFQAFVKVMEAAADKAILQAKMESEQRRDDATLSDIEMMRKETAKNAREMLAKAAAADFTYEHYTHEGPLVTRIPQIEELYNAVRDKVIGSLKSALNRDPVHSEFNKGKRALFNRLQALVDKAAEAYWQPHEQKDGPDTGFDGSASRLNSLNAKVSGTGR